MDYFLDYFHKYGASDFAFLKVAETLFAAYEWNTQYIPESRNDLLWSVSRGKDEVQNVGFVLLGYAMENAIKAHLAHISGGAIDEDGNVKKDEFKSHDLRDFHEKAYCVGGEILNSTEKAKLRNAEVFG
jgi:hypothetical protein